MNNYDVCIIGGGIAGLYSALQLSKKSRVLLLDERNYPGGRILTHPQEGYEIGAARFNDNHKILLKLIKKYKLTPIPLPTRIDYISNKGSVNRVYPNIQNSYGNMLDTIIRKTKPSNKLKNITFFEHAASILGSYEQAQYLVDVFGYYSEIKEMNAYDAYITFKTDFGNIQYYVLKEGLSHLCRLMVKDILKNKSDVLLNTEVLNVLKNKDSSFEIKSNKLSFVASRVIFAVKPYQLKRFNVVRNIHKHIKSVYQAPLIRIYARFPTPFWFNDIYRTTTNNLLRQVIPINKDTGLIMVSYVDGIDTKPFLRDNGELKTKSQIRNIVMKNLRLIFSHKKIPDPIYFGVHLWKVGCHHSLPKFDSDEIRRQVVNPSDNIFICGEGFSKKQAWMEGALETADSVLSILKN